MTNNTTKNTKKQAPAQECDCSMEDGLFLDIFGEDLVDDLEYGIEKLVLMTEIAKHELIIDKIKEKLDKKHGHEIEKIIGKMDKLLAGVRKELRKDADKIEATLTNAKAQAEKDPKKWEAQRTERMDKINAKIESAKEKALEDSEEFIELLVDLACVYDED